MKIHHVALSVHNIDRSIDWYKNNLGFQLETKYEKHNLTIAHLVLGDARVELFSSADSKPLPQDRQTLKSDLRVIGTKHVCFEVDDIQGLVNTLKTRGVDFETETDTAGFGGKYVFIKDLDGILIELYQK